MTVLTQSALNLLPLVVERVIYLRPIMIHNFCSHFNLCPNCNRSGASTFSTSELARVSRATSSTPLLFFRKTPPSGTVPHPKICIVNLAIDMPSSFDCALHHVRGR